MIYSINVIIFIIKSYCADKENFPCIFYAMDNNDLYLYLYICISIRIQMLHICSTVLLPGLDPACSSDSSSSALSLSLMRKILSMIFLG